MPAQALQGFANALQQHLERMQEAQGQGGADSSGLIGPEGPIDLSKLN